MNALQIVRALGPVDWKNVQRDPLLRWMALAPLLIAALLRYGVPFLAGRLYELLAFDLRAYDVLIVSFMSMALPMVSGMVIGFLLLDQRDDHTLLALQVTPLSLAGYLGYRITFPALLSVLGSLIVFAASGLAPLSLAELLAAALSGALFAPLFALLYASFAANKVQGFAVSKASGVVLIPPIAAYFVHGSWQWVFGLVPTFWPVRFYWALAAHEAHAWLYALIGVAYQALLLWLLARRFAGVMSRE